MPAPPPRLNRPNATNSPAAGKRDVVLPVVPLKPATPELDEQGKYKGVYSLPLKSVDILSCVYRLFFSIFLTFFSVFNSFFTI